MREKRGKLGLKWCSVRFWLLEREREREKGGKSGIPVDLGIPMDLGNSQGFGNLPGMRQIPKERERRNFKRSECV